MREGITLRGGGTLRYCIHMTISRSIAAFVAFSLLAATVPAAGATPWAMIAGRVIGRVEKMTKPPEGDQPGIDVATVVLNADASKVYATTAAMLHRNAQVHVASESADRRAIEFSSGSRSASITVRDLARHPALADGRCCCYQARAEPGNGGDR